MSMCSSCDPPPHTNDYYSGKPLQGQFHRLKTTGIKNRIKCRSVSFVNTGTHCLTIHDCLCYEVEMSQAAFSLASSVGGKATPIEWDNNRQLISSLASLK